ncbi:Zinc finger CCCH-type domain and Ribonuclease Zc3h12a domain-containing protein [Trichostrongylus colubriformis]|uniref:Zinc finger CCCH-type domain and Ribonuclease Zc3h12a domain-containing protein n=1 Tax=Trichostrongylus colubriformis TaxID=6319 RepID=A0AAN8ETK2_TRICO
MERKHPPLRRVSRVMGMSAAPLGKGVRRAELNEEDSCYSSCSEESHPSLSRESSDTICPDFGLGRLHLDDSAPEAVTPTSAPPHLVEFARNLGYSESRLISVLERVGCDAGQDRILSELVQMGRDTCGVQPDTAVATPTASALRPIVIDGSNIAMTHGRKEVFSCAGIRDCVRFFTDRGHDDVLVFIPQYRREAARADCPITDKHILDELDAERRIVWTPSRRINGRRIVCHDDLYILKTAEEKDAVVVSNDAYRDLLREHPQYRRIVEQRLLMYSFVDGKFMPPEDPLGRYGPRLQQFLSNNSTPSTAQLCPYARKCTYGSKCKYYHPERPNGMHVSVTDRLMREKNQNRPPTMHHLMHTEKAGVDHRSIGRTRSLNYDPRTVQENKAPSRDFSMMSSWHNVVGRNASVPLSFTKSEQETGTLFTPSTAVWGRSELSVGPLNPQEVSMDRAQLQYHLSKIFPEHLVTSVLQSHPYETNSQRLCQYILDLQKGFD